MKEGRKEDKVLKTMWDDNRAILASSPPERHSHHICYIYSMYTSYICYVYIYVFVSVFIILSLILPSLSLSLSLPPSSSSFCTAWADVRTDCPWALKAVRSVGSTFREGRKEWHGMVGVEGMQ